MADEATIRSHLQIRRGNLEYSSQPTAFTADVNTGKGPTPGALTVTAAGENISVAELTTPGLYRIMNVGRADGEDDDTCYIEYGIHDGSLFHPWGEILPGESFVGRMSRNIGEEEDVPGTGTSGTINAPFVRAGENGPAQIVIVEIFER